MPTSPVLRDENKCVLISWQTFLQVFGDYDDERIKLSGDEANVPESHDAVSHSDRELLKPVLVVDTRRWQPVIWENCKSQSSIRGALTLSRLRLRRLTVAVRFGLCSLDAPQKAGGAP